VSSEIIFNYSFKNFPGGKTMESMEERRKYYDFGARIDAEPERIFPLLCPVREYEWIAPWKCELIYSRSGIAEAGCVFVTDFEERGGREVWVVSHYEPCRKIAFVRTGAKRTIRFEITLFPQDSYTTLQLRQEITWLDARRNIEYTQAEYRAQMEGLMAMLKHFLRTGTMLQVESN
jgi:hypothetical protein